MDKNLKCIMCGSLISVAVAGSIYCFTEKYCEDCRAKIEEQKHVAENTIPTNTRQLYVGGLSGTAFVIDTSTSPFDHDNFWKNIKIN
jgi:hypothetical protein